jgi:hypothetical protein
MLSSCKICTIPGSCFALHELQNPLFFFTVFISCDVICAQEEDWISFMLYQCSTTTVNTNAHTHAPADRIQTSENQQGWSWGEFGDRRKHPSDENDDIHLFMSCSCEFAGSSLSWSRLQPTWLYESDVCANAMRRWHASSNCSSMIVLPELICYWFTRLCVDALAC